MNDFDWEKNKYNIFLIIICIAFVCLVLNAFRYIPDSNSNDKDFEAIKNKIEYEKEESNKQDTMEENNYTENDDNNTYDEEAEDNPRGRHRIIYENPTTTEEPQEDISLGSLDTPPIPNKE